MDISIVTPFYKGNAYIPQLLNWIEKAASQIPTSSVEWLILNDSPNIEVNKISTNAPNLNIKFLVNPRNLGIQKTRINGINQSSGKYILLLDQDDEITSDAFKIHLQNFANSSCDLSITNGFSEDKNGSLTPLFKSKHQLQKTSSLRLYFTIGNLIASPGMVMIRKEAISNPWKDNPLKINGADDWLLWVFMLSEGAKISTVFANTYTHKAVEQNTSDDNEKMIESSLEALNIFEATSSSRFMHLCKAYRRRLAMRQAWENDGKSKAKAYLSNLDLAWDLFMYKFL